MMSIIEAISLLRPYDTNLSKIRIGPKGDGGYIFLRELLRNQTVLSYGISTEYRFDEEMGDRGHLVYMFDHTIEGVDTNHKNLHFFKEGVAGASQPDRSLFSLGDHLVRNNIEGDNLILKMDVEGCEYDAFNNTSDPVLARFEQIVIELHDMHKMDDDSFRADFVRFMTRLNRDFTIFHVHANNCDGCDGLKIIRGVPVTNLIELSLVRTSSVERKPSQTIYPTALDYPCTYQRDKLLWFFPFVPTSATTEAFLAGAERNELLGEKFYLEYLLRNAREGTQ